MFGFIFIPLKMVHCKYSKRHTPWLTDFKCCSIKARHKAKLLAEHTKDPSDISNYKCIKNKLKSEIHSANWII